MRKICIQNKIHHFLLNTIPLLHHYQCPFLIFFTTQFIKGILLQSISLISFSCISIILLMILIRITLNKEINRIFKLIKDLLILTINILTISILFFHNSEPTSPSTSTLLDLALSELLFIRTLRYKQSKVISISVFFLTFLFKLQINDYKIVFNLITVSLLALTIANEVEGSNHCELCQLSNNDLFLTLDSQLQITSQNNNFQRFLQQKHLQAKSFFHSLRGKNLLVKKEYLYQPELKEIITDVLNDEQPCQAITLGRFIEQLQSRNEKNLFCLGKCKIDELQDKEVVVYIIKRKKKMFIKIKRDKAFEEALNLRSLTKNYAHTIYYLAHELRNSLNCILNLELVDLKEKYSMELLATEYLQPAIISARMMLNLVNGLLDFAQIEANTFKLVLSKVDLNELMEEIVKIYKVQTHNRGLIMELYVDKEVGKVQSDPNRIKQILINLISNALKYTRSGKIVLRASRINLHKVKISVVDTGLGIEENDLDKLFHAFSKIQNKEDFNLNAQGVGLGLLISNQLAYLLNKSEGGISVSSKLKQGSEFTFIICDMKSEEDYEISLSTHKASNLSCPPCKLIRNSNESVIIKIIEQRASSFSSNSFQESEFINKDCDVFKIDVPSYNCFEIQDDLGNRKEGEAYKDSMNRVDKNYMNNNEKVKSKSEIEPKAKLKAGQKEKSAPFLANHSDQISREEDSIDLSQDKTRSRSKEKSLTAIDSSSLIRKRVERIRRSIEEKGCTCPVALIIDDNDFNILSMKTHLKKFSINCESALSGEIALQKIFKIHESTCCKYFKYIFLDLEMPEKNGFVIYKEISNFYRNFGLVDSMIILNTGYSKSSDIVKEAIAKGIRHILIKPITQMNLVELIDPLKHYKIRY